MRDVLEFLDSASAEYKVDTYDVIGPSIEDVFLQLMRKNDPSSEKHALDSVDTVKSESEGSVMKLTNSRPTNVWKQAATIFYKRLLVVRKSWFTPLAMLLVAVFGSCIPLVFLDNNRAPACGTPLRNATSNSIYLPTSPYLLYRSVNATGDSRILTSPPGLIDSLGPSTQTLPVLDVPDQNTFLSTISENYRNISLGGVSMDLATGDAVFAWEATQPGIGSLTLLNLISNLHLNQALNDTSPSEFPTLIQTSFGNFPLIVAGTLSALRWVAFFGATMVRSVSLLCHWISSSRMVDSGCLPGVRCSVCVQGAQNVRASYAVLQWLVEPSRVVVGPLALRYSSHHDRVDCHRRGVCRCQQSVCWVRVLGG